MTGAYRRIHSGRMWWGQMQSLRRQNPLAHTTLLYLHTGPSSNFIGFYALSPEVAAHDLCYTADEFRRAMKVLAKRGHAFYDERAGVVYVPTALEFDPISTKEQARGAVQRIESLPPTKLLGRLRKDVLRRLPSAKRPDDLRPLLEYLRIVPPSPEESRTPSDTRSHAPSDTPSDIRQTLTPSPSPSPAPTPSPSPTPSGDTTTGSRGTAPRPPHVSFPPDSSGGPQDGGAQVPLTAAEEAFTEIVFPMTHEWQSRDLWLKALRLPGAIEAVEKAAAMLNGANAHDGIRKPGAFLWAKFQELRGQRQ